MAEFGIVTQLQGEFANVEIERSEACQHCNACLPSLTGQKMVLYARNAANAKPGDKVTISLTQNGFLSAISLLYVIPAAVFLVLLLVSYLLNLSEWLCLGIAIAGVAVAYVLLHKYEKKLNKERYTPVIDKILEEQPSV
ncbi:MAG: SoxR reducing system RseC family protein [Firmicutes bacterium]|nr:SoxR reducing system RseC family protein [Bacillota bacterium]